MQLVLKKHPKADDTVYVLTSGEKVWVYGKQNDLYLVVCKKDGKQFFQKKEQFKYPETLKF